MAMTLKVGGLRTVENTLGVLAPKESRQLNRRLVVRIARRVRDDVRQAAREVVRRRTGALFRAIRHKRERGRRDVFEASVTVNLKGGSGAHIAPHWHFIEFGTVKQRATPYIRPTVKAWDSQIFPAYREEFGEQLEKQLAKRAR